jgi:DNA (cytosine-5)-methyltransferase 1
MGYSRAGFEVVGVDIKPQPRYPFEFHQQDALDALRNGWVGLFSESPNYLDVDWFDVIHASPPCQHYANVTRWKGNQDEHPDLIAPTRELLEATGLPYVIENVRTVELRADFVLCGTGLGLPIRRHRFFETNWSGMRMNPGCHHTSWDYSFDHGAKQSESVYRDAMGCEWMTVQESREAIPPAYTEFIGEHLWRHLYPHLYEPIDFEPTEYMHPDTGLLA